MAVMWGMSAGPAGRTRHGDVPEASFSVITAPLLASIDSKIRDTLSVNSIGGLDRGIGSGLTPHQSIRANATPTVHSQSYKKGIKPGGVSCRFRGTRLRPS